MYMDMKKLAAVALAAVSLSVTPAYAAASPVYTVGSPVGYLEANPASMETGSVHFVEQDGYWLDPEGLSDEQTQLLKAICDARTLGMPGEVDLYQVAEAYGTYDFQKAGELLANDFYYRAHFLFVPNVYRGWCWRDFGESGYFRMYFEKDTALTREYKAQIIETAKSLVTEGQDAVSAEAAVRKYVQDHFTYEAQEGIDLLNYRECFLSTGVGDCSDYADTYCALMNACGIRTERILNSTSTHCWNRVWLGSDTVYDYDVTWNQKDPAHYAAVPVEIMAQIKDHDPHVFSVVLAKTDE